MRVVGESPRWQDMRMSTARTLTSVAMALVAFLGAGCGRVIKVVVPDGFSGEARVVFDPAAGQPLKPEGPCYVGAGFRSP